MTWRPWIQQKEELDIHKTVTFGSIEGRYDVVVRPRDTNRVVRELRKRYEPLKYFAPLCNKMNR